MNILCIYIYTYFTIMHAQALLTMSSHETIFPDCVCSDLLEKASLSNVHCTTIGDTMRQTARRTSPCELSTIPGHPSPVTLNTHSKGPQPKPSTK